jgi:succinate dehydrogenase / fumarate reductase cytochrome b subunit
VRVTGINAFPQPDGREVHDATRDMGAASRRRRPVFLNLAQIQMPVGALTSIAHRLTGIFLALGVPFAIHLLDLSLQGPQSYALVTALFDDVAFRVVAIVFVWVLAHHVLAGIRHMLSDVDIGSQLPAARRSAWVVNLGGIAIAALALGALL